MAEETKQQSFLIVDENTNNSLYWEMTLKAEFPEVKIKVCKTGYDALDVSKSEHFTFFISSWEITPMSGFVLMQKLREVRKYKYTHFLIISQVLSEEDLELAKEFGITNYLLKPFDKPRVIEKINAMIAEENALDPTQKTLRKIEDWVAENKVSEALKLITEFLKAGPYAARAYSLNGDIWARTEHQDKAEKSYTQALGYDADYAPALSGLGKLLLRQNKYTEAVALFEKMNKGSPRNMTRMVNLGNALLDSGNEAKAEEVFKNVRKTDEGNGDAAVGLGKVAFKRGNIDLAAKFFKESGKGEDLASYFNQMAIAMVNQNKFDEAVGVYRNAIKVLPDQTKVHLLEFNIGLAYKKSERLGDATDAFARSLLANPTYEKAYSSLVNTAKDAQAKQQKFNGALANEALQKYKQHLAAKQEAS